MGQHYLSDQHQHCILRFIETQFPQTSKTQVKSVLQSFDEQDRQTLTAVTEKIDSLNQELNPIIDNCCHLTSTIEKNESNIKEIRMKSNQIKESCDKNEETTQSINQTLLNINKLVNETKSKLPGSLKLLSPDGTYTFKVHILSIIDNKQTIQSEPVHTSPSGYKLAIRCSIYVDEHSQTSYVSISFIINVGEFDAILSWPFSYPVVLSIRELNGTKKNMECSISWQSQFVTMHRPTNDKKSSLHMEKFCPVDTLLTNEKNYLQDGFIFVHLQIDFLASCVTTNANQEKLMKTTSNFIQTNIFPNVPTK